MKVCFMYIIGLFDIKEKRKYTANANEKQQCKRCGSYKTKTHFSPPVGRYYSCCECGYSSEPKWWY